MSRQFCTEVTPQCPVEWTTYGYYPNLGGNAFLLVLFAVCFFAQLVIGWKTKVRAFAIVVAIGCGLESIGYGGRIMMNENPWSSDGFKMQICCLILAPSFLAAGYYLTIKTVVNHLGMESSKLAPRWYTWIVRCRLHALWSCRMRMIVDQRESFADIAPVHRLRSRFDSYTGCWRWHCLCSH
jgi:hypothetical protein